MQRLRELDFLRGIAIIFVLIRHQHLSSFTTQAGWIGVDLFFVLSGFLISGLLFKEHMKFGKVDPMRFLLRRGFKIYPIYYIFYILYLTPILLNDNLNILGLLADLTFTQNYVNGWGYAYGASWSLAVEEHFYICFSLLLWYGLNNNYISFKPSNNNNKSISSFEYSLRIILLLCLIFRIISNIYFPSQIERNFTMTHLRLDSLIAGVYISYLYYFRFDYLTTIINKYKYLLILIAISGLAWTPFVDAIPSFFAKTFGFTLLYISFGIILIFFITEKKINTYLDRIFSALAVNLISKIGFCSYSIYIIHTFVNTEYENIIQNHNLHFNNYFNFLITSILSIIFGIFMTYKIEKYFLKMRNRYYPSKV